MRNRALLAATLAAIVLPAVARAQSPVATAFKADAGQVAKKLMAGADLMPADKFSFKPTPAQMSFADIVMHLSGGNDALCGAIGGKKAPTRSKLTAADSKDVLVARLKETFQFCDEAFAALDDSKLSEQFTLFGQSMTRASAMTTATGDWADHYSQVAIYLRLNGVLPPGAKK